jgi:drug/metabolite transporter (DMT)-like permease
MTASDTPTASIEKSASGSFGRLRLSGSVVVGFAWAALTVTIFSGWFVVTRFSVTRELQIWDIIALRFGIGAVLLMPAVLRPRARLPLRSWLDGLLFALLWGMPFVLLVALGLRLTSAAQAASIAPTSMPVFAGLLGWLFMRERQGPLRWLGYTAIVTGLIALIAAGAAVHGMPSLTGIAALMLAAAMWAVYTLLFRRSRLTPIQSAALICIWSAILFLPAYLLFGLGRIGHVSTSELVVQTIYQGVLMSAVASVTFNRSVALLGPSAATAIIALVPVGASLLAVPTPGELPAPAECAAIAAIVAGVFLAAKPARPGHVSPNPSYRKADP